jgi:hypothetical protein
MEDVFYILVCLVDCVWYWELFGSKVTVLNKTHCYVQPTFVMLCIVHDGPYDI